MISLKDFLKQLSANHDISLQELSKRLGYKSKTSIDRMISGRVGAGAMNTLKSRLISSHLLTNEEETDLQELIDIRTYGIDRTKAFRLLHDMLTHSVTCGLRGFRLSDSNGKEILLVDHINEHKINHVRIYNCVYSEFFDVIRLLLRDTSATIEQYITFDGTETMLIRALSGILDMMVEPRYKAFAYNNDNDHTAALRGLESSDIIVLEVMNGASGVNQCGIIVPDSYDHGTYIPLQGDALPDVRQYQPLNRSCPAALSFEGFLDYCGMLMKFERNCATYDFKPDICIMYVPFPILYAAYVSSPFPKEFLTSNAIKALASIFEARIKNTYSKHKPTYAIMSPTALSRFANTGLTSDHVPMMRPFTVAERVSILEALLLNCKKNPWFEIYLRKDDMLKDYNICCYSGRGFYMALKSASCMTENSPEVLLTPPASFYTLFETYYRKELIRNHCYSAAESREKLETILWNLKCM